MKTFTALLLTTASCLIITVASGQLYVPYSFSLDNAPLRTSLPIDVVPDVAAGDYPTAHLTSTGDGFSVQPADVLGFTPVGFSGYCLYPKSINASDLLISFNKPMHSISLLYAPEEYGCDNSCVMKISAYSGTTLIGTNFAQIQTPGTWPTGTLSFTGVTSFDNVVVHYQTPPSGENWGPIFMVDNLAVTVVTVVPPPPPIALLPDGTIAISWTNSLVGWQLQSNTNLNNTNGWINVTNTPVSVNNYFQVTVQPAWDAMFFRWLYPY